MKRALAAITGFLCLGVHSFAFAASGDELQLDLEAWKSGREDETRQQLWLDQDAELQFEVQLFPDAPDGEGESALDRARDERIGDYVTANIEGSLVVFLDVPRTSWFAPYVRDIAERGIVSGYRDTAGKPSGYFGPGDNVTIEQMAKVMVLAAGKLSDDCPAYPVNLSASGNWSASYVSCAEKSGWVVYSDGTADVRQNATRGQVIVTMLQAFGVTPGPRTGTGFADVSFSTQFGSFIEKAQTDGIVSGYTDDDGIPNGLFGPEDPVTRAEFAKIVTLGKQQYAD